MREWLILKLLNGDRNLLSKIIMKSISFVKSIDVEQFERDSTDLWSSMGYSYKGLSKWIEDRKALLLLQNLIESSDKNGIRAVLNEWQLVESFISVPVALPDRPISVDVGPELRTKEEIMAAFAGGQKE